MSEMTLITKRYGDIVDFTSRVNKSVIAFKKRSFLADKANREKYPKLMVSDTEIEAAKETLVQSLVNLEKLASATEYNNKLLGGSEYSTLQNFIIRSDTDKKEIEAIINSLREDKPLTKTNFSMLDKIITILDGERSMLFRKLRTVRG